MTFDPFDVVAVPFPFTDKAAAKRRPALVVSAKAFNARHDQLVLAMITTAQRSDWPSDVVIADWARAGLSVPCRVRLKLFTLDATLVAKRIGALAKKDRDAVRQALTRALAVA
ncbi:MAG: type II toxin-antitoxin system PemK/MazF family toxin [Rhodospirillales bacterium]|nr:type II toxin-antitoxin system PemK/MazF family toxin [Rhodospirillales bacterium]